VAVIASPKLARKPATTIYLIVLAIYGLSKLASGAARSADPELVYIILAEAVLLFLAYYIARVISLSISSMENSVHSVVFHLDQYRVLPEREGEKAVTEEILRARRYEHDVTLVYIQIPRLQKRPLLNLDRAAVLERKYIYSRVVRILYSLIDETAIVFTHRHNLVVTLSEATQDEVATFVNQLERMLLALLPEKPEITTARFPEQALVYEDLIAVARKRPISQPARVPIGRASEAPSLQEMQSVAEETP
jgi:hypothetical protein